MAERMSTARRMDRNRILGRVVRAENGHLKKKERASRDARMAELIKKGKHPYIPAVQSWLSEKLGIPFSQVTEEQVRAYLAR
jgi:hypothetical protein